MDFSFITIASNVQRKNNTGLCSYQFIIGDHLFFLPFFSIPDRCKRTISLDEYDPSTKLDIQCRSCVAEKASQPGM